MARNMVRFPFWEKVILADIQYCVNFCCMAKGLSYIYTYIFFKNILLHLQFITGC